MIVNVALDFLTNAWSPHFAKSLFGSINRNNPTAIVPARQFNRPISDDGVMLEILPPNFDQFLTHHRLTADPRTEHHRMARRLHRFKLLDPFLDRKLLFVIVILGKKITMLT